MIKTAQELTDFSKGEESLLEKQIKDIADTGAKVVVSGGKIGDLALHYLNKYGLMGVRLTSKWDVRRLCRAVNATPLPKITPPTAEELGYADTVRVDELVRPLHCAPKIFLKNLPIYEQSRKLLFFLICLFFSLG